MRLYVAGPMTGYPHYNVAAFKDAARRWGLAGHEVWTPFDANSEVWRRHHHRDFDPYIDACDYGDPILAEMFAEDVRVLTECDAVVLLPGWEKSRGARCELVIALTLGKTILLDATGEPVNLTMDLTFTEAS